MDNITTIEGPALDYLLLALGIRVETDVYRIRIWQTDDGSGIKIKVNEGMWSPALGMRDA